MADKTTKKPKTEAEKEKARAERERTKARRTIKAARKAGKGSFGKAKPGVRAIAGGKKLSLSAEARLNAAVQKEVESGRIKVGNRVYVMGKPEMTSAEYSKMLSRNSSAEALRELAKRDPVYAAEVRARELALETGASRAEAEKAGKQAAKEEAARQKAKASGKVAPKETPKAEEKPKAKKPAVKKEVVKKPEVKKEVVKKDTTPKSTKATPEIKKQLDEFGKKVSKGLTAMDYEDKIKAVEKQMADNAKAVRAGTMTEAEKVKANKALAEQKNKLQADAKKAGAKVNNPATRPPRQPKAEKPAVKKTKVEKKAKPAPKKQTKPVAEKTPKSSTTKGKTVTKGAKVPKSVATQVAKEAVKETGLPANQAVKKVGKGFLRGALKKAGWVGVALTAFDIIDGLGGKGPLFDFKNTAPKVSLQQAKKNLGQQAKSLGVKTKGGNSVKQGQKLAGKRYQAQADYLKGMGPKKLTSTPIAKAKPSTGKPSSGKPSATPSVNKKGQTVITIKRGDTLWDIAQKNKTTVDAIYKANPFLMERKKAGKVQIFSGTTIRLPK